MRSGKESVEPIAHHLRKFHLRLMDGIVTKV